MALSATDKQRLEDLMAGRPVRRIGHNPGRKNVNNGYLTGRQIQYEIDALLRRDALGRWTAYTRQPTGRSSAPRPFGGRSGGAPTGLLGEASDEPTKGDVLGRLGKYAN